MNARIILLTVLLSFNISVANAQEIIECAATIPPGVTVKEIPIGWTEEWSPSFIKISSEIINDADLKITVAHEFNHACQMADSYVDVYNGALWFSENTAVWVAYVIYNYQYKYFRRFYDEGGDNPLHYPYAKITALDYYKYSGFLFVYYMGVGSGLTYTLNPIHLSLMNQYSFWQ